MTNNNHLSQSILKKHIENNNISKEKILELITNKDILESVISSANTLNIHEVLKNADPKTISEFENFLKQIK